LNGRRQSFHKMGSLFTFSGGRSRTKVNASQRQDLSIHGKGAYIVPRVSLHLIVTQKAGYDNNGVGKRSRPGQFEAAVFVDNVICIFRITAGSNLQGFVAFGSLCDVVKINSSNDNFKKEHRHFVAPDLFTCTFACNSSPNEIYFLSVLSWSLYPKKHSLYSFLAFGIVCHVVKMTASGNFLVTQHRHIVEQAFLTCTFACTSSHNGRSPVPNDRRL
jgi:hypothetical protein